jgi:hypothetical protein
VSSRLHVTSSLTLFWSPCKIKLRREPYPGLAFLRSVKPITTSGFRETSMTMNYAYTPQIWPSILMVVLMITLSVYSGRRRSVAGGYQGHCRQTSARRMQPSSYPRSLRRYQNLHHLDLSRPGRDRCRRLAKAEASAVLSGGYAGVAARH